MNATYTPTHSPLSDLLDSGPSRGLYGVIGTGMVGETGRTDVSDASLVASCNYHFGNTPGIYHGAAFVGHSVTLPMRVLWLDDSSTKAVTFVFRTQDVETWGDLKGHQVFANDEPIGRLKDPDDHDGRYEMFRISVERSQFERLIGPKRSFFLTVVLETQPDHPILSDDFLLGRIEVENATIRLGT